MKFKNLVFDLGNVIVDVDRKRFTDAMGWRYEDFAPFFRSSRFRVFETEKGDEAGYFRQLSEYVPISPGDEMRYRELLHLSFPLRGRTWGIIHWLRLRYRLFLFSNTNLLDFRAVNTAVGLTHPFEKVYLSYEQGALKPEKTAYERAGKLFGIRPSETCFFDDLEANVRGARSAGWQAFRVESEDGLIRDMKKVGIIDDGAVIV